MTKVDELREMILHWNRYSDVPRVSQSAVDNLIDAARSEGVAEGAERLANQIRFHGGQYTQKGDLVASDYITYAKARVDLFIVPASVLAPEVKP